MIDTIELVTYPYEMGEEEAKKCGFNPTVIGSIQKEATTSADTTKAAEEMLELKVDLILFAGGDGTARDIYEAIDGKVAVLGIPSGVKIHSAVYAVNPERGGDLVVRYLQDGLPLQEAEVMDVDEEAFRQGRVSARLYGYLRVPFERGSTQSAKSGSAHTEDEEYQKKVIAACLLEEMKDDCFYIIGPGSTTQAIGEQLGFEKTLLGVDVMNQGRLVAKDVNESQLLRLVEGRKAKIVITPIGGQGYIFGRGNQQISPEVIRRVGKDNIMILATKNKMNSLVGKPLLVDTGDEEVDGLLAGYTRVIVGYRKEIMKMIAR
jgi:predicted polyphosphate/ATP-dependent NAD kinase